MEAENSFISVDWGTSNLRIRFVSDSDFQIQGEFFYNHGIKKMNKVLKKVLVGTINKSIRRYRAKKIFQSHNLSLRALI